MHHTTVMARSRADLANAPMFSLIRANTKLKLRLPRTYWEIFEIDGTVASDAVRAAAKARGLPAARNAEPERCDDTATADVTDEDAALAYLRENPQHALVKLPDTIGSKRYRLYVCADDSEAQPEQRPGRRPLHVGRKREQLDVEVLADGPVEARVRLKGDRVQMVLPRGGRWQLHHRGKLVCEESDQEHIALLDELVRIRREG